jgi:LmbE family N-acetylglucosaminyl deacetylase
MVAKQKRGTPVKRFVSDLRQNWDARPFFWTEGEVTGGLKVRVPSQARVMVLGPHPDDPESVAITCRLLVRSGCDLHYAIVSMSPSGVEDQYAQTSHDRHSVPLRERKIAIRKREQIMSAGTLGLTEDRIAFLHLEENNGGIPLDCPENKARIELLLESAAPDIVIMPAGKDANQTHAWVHRVFREYARISGAGRKRPMVGLYNEDPKTTAIETDLFVLFGEESAKWKGALLRIHDSQQQRNMRLRQVGFDERILQVNRQRYERLLESDSRKKFSAGYAEVFEIELFGSS